MILAIDIGSGSLRVALVDTDTVECVRIWRSRPGLPTLDLPSRQRGIDVRTLMSDTRSLVDAASAYAAARGIVITGLTCTSARYAIVMTGESELLTWANSDRSAVEASAALQSSMDDAAAARVGGWPTPLSMISRVTSAEHVPRGAVVQPLHAWVLCQFGASPHYDLSSAADSRTFDVMAGEWIDVDALTLPPVVDAGGRVGTVSGVEGLDGVPIFASFGDTLASAGAFAGLCAGDVVVVAGTTTPLVLMTDRYLPTEVEVANWSPVSTGRKAWFAERNTGRTGHGVEWLSRLTGVDLVREDLMFAPSGVQVFLGQSLASPRQFATLVPPHAILMDPSTGPDLPGAPAIARGAIEANAWATAFHVTELLGVHRRSGGTRSGRVIVCGGQSRSELFVRSLAAAVVAPVYTFPRESSLIGAALGGAPGAAIDDAVAVEPADVVDSRAAEWVSSWRSAVTWPIGHTLDASSRRA